MGPQERVALRASAVLAVRGGEKKRHVAKHLGVTRQTLHNWVMKHKLGGTQALTAKPRGRARRQVLEPWQEAKIAGAIMLLPPGTVNQGYTRWTRKAIAEHAIGLAPNGWGSTAANGLRFMLAREAKRALESDHRRSTTVEAKLELTEIDREILGTYPMMSVFEPRLQI